MSEPLRIAYLTSLYSRPSDTFIRNEVNQLRKLGLEIRTFSIRRPEIEKDVEDDVRQHQAPTEYLLERGIPRIALVALKQATMHPVRFFRSVRLAIATAPGGVKPFMLQLIYLIEAIYLAARLQSHRIQVLHNHIGENSATVAMLASEFSGIPFTQTIHGPYVFFAPQRWALGEKLRRARFTACISDFCRSQCMMHAPEAAWPRLEVVRCSVQPEFVESDVVEHSNAAATPRFLCIGRLCTEKGQLVLIEAARQLRDAGKKFRVTLAGDGPGRAAIEKRIRQYNLQDVVELLGWQNSQQLRDLLGQSTALVIASFAEGLPIVTLESLAMRRPVIATNIAAMSEIVEHGRSGWLVSPGSAEKLCEAILEASDLTPAQLHAMGEFGRKRVLELHLPRRQAERLRDLLLAAARS